MVGISTSANALDYYKIDSEHTFPIFEVSHLGLSTQRGRFNKTSGQIYLDQVAKKGEIEVTIETSSIDMGFAGWDKQLRSEDFFNTDKFSTMKFSSNHFVFSGDTPIAAEGALTLLGITRPVKLDIAHFQCIRHPFFKTTVCGADVSATIKRSEWGMTQGIPLVSDTVNIHIPVEALKLAPPNQP